MATGLWQDDARTEIKTAANLYPLQFVDVKAKAKNDGGEWEQSKSENSYIRCTI